MIDEAQLRTLLEVAGDEVPLPSPDATGFIRALADDATPRPRRPKLVWSRGLAAAVALLALVVGVGAWVSQVDGGNRFNRATTGDRVSANVSGDEDRLRAVEDQGGAGGTSAASGVQTLIDGAKIARTGSVELEVRKGQFGLTLERLTSLATGTSGYVASSETSETAAVPHGTVTLRVPVASFDEVVGNVRRMGKVRAVTSKAQDVTAQYVDRETRLKALTAERDQLLTILTEARNIPDILAVRDRSTQVQTEIEQLQGQQRLLDDQTSFATLAVTIAEPGRTGLDSAEEERSGLGDAWHDGVDGFVNGVEAILAASGTILIVLLCLAAVAFTGRVGLRFARRRFV